MNKMQRLLWAAILFAGSAAAAPKGVETTAVFRHGGGVSYDPARDTGASATETFARGVVTYEPSPYARLHGNAYVSLFGGSGAAFLARGQEPFGRGRYRSEVLQSSWLETDRSEGVFVVDRLYVDGRAGSFRWAVGRQALSLATTFFFTPNDFFEPYYALRFFREYKPGVDAAKLEWSWGPLSYGEVIAVAGFEAGDSDSRGTEEENEFSARASAVLLRATANVAGVQVTGFTGRLGRFSVVGSSFQTDWAGLGFRGEGHWKRRRGTEGEENEEENGAVALAVEKHLGSNTFVQAEQFYNSSGYETPQDLRSVLREGSISTGGYYPAQHYSAVGLRHEWTPLWQSQPAVVVNDSDGSALFAWRQELSLSNEATAGLTVNWPFGLRPEAGFPQSEFGTYPRSLQADTTVYF